MRGGEKIMLPVWHQGLVIRRVVVGGTDTGQFSREICVAGMYLQRAKGVRARPCLLAKITLRAGVHVDKLIGRDDTYSY